MESLMRFISRRLLPARLKYMVCIEVWAWYTTQIVPGECSPGVIMADVMKSWKEVRVNAQYSNKQLQPE